ncbi:putative nutrient reservoir [Hibiscus syriacus]|uniref:Nutrient reservoir n=1 Tax=Hibiscus syriacus TaxID=106335 RepID=A0A6A3CWQ6_HIBSY|nr:putative nutrient reservoir [Hibiscus syriacus]
MTASSKATPNSNSEPETIPTIPIELLSEEEMVLIEAACAATRSTLSFFSISSSPSSRFQTNKRMIQSITLLSKRALNGSSELDIEDSDSLKNTQKRVRIAQPFLHRNGVKNKWNFPSSLANGKQQKAMKAGKARHVELEEEVVKKLKVRVESVKDSWALKFINFITCANQLLFEGLTREIPLVGFVEGIWLVGIIDELRMPETGSDRNPIIVDMKTRVLDSLPSEQQRRNGRLQLMCYKYLWDTLVADSFPSEQFFDFFSLNRNYILSEDIRERELLIQVFQLSRDELQKDQSILGEDQFAYDPEWLKNQIKNNLELWLGEREASYTPEEERWKCRHCQFALETRILIAHVAPLRTLIITALQARDDIF